MSEENFKKALEFLFPAEGGYVNHKDDKGGPTNMGITQYTYDAYNKKNKLPQKKVKNITREEAEQIYYDEFWIPSGADKINDPDMAAAVFDTAVLHGPKKAKEFYNNCEGDVNNILDLRLKEYDSIVSNDPTQKVFLKGWQNRVENLKNSIKNGDFAKSETVIEIPIEDNDSTVLDDMALHLLGGNLPKLKLNENMLNLETQEEPPKIAVYCQKLLNFLWNNQ